MQAQASAKRQARQAKGKMKNRYVIKVMRLNREGGAVPLVRVSNLIVLLAIA
jgi:hypothetical protein